MRTHLLFSLFVALTAAACAKSADQRVFTLQGQVLAVQPAHKSVEIKHEAVKGLMPAMTMLFKVDAATLKAAIKDQTITATLVQEGGDFWLRDVKAAPTQK